MKRRQWTPLLAGVLPIAVLGVRALQGCYSAVPNNGLVDAGPPPKSDVMVFEASAESGYIGAGDSACSSSPGDLPALDCYFGAGVSCAAASPACTVSKNAAGGSCGEPLCLPMANNSGPVKNFRMEAIYITQPSTLANTFLQNGVVTSAVTLNATASGGTTPTCGYGVTQGLSVAGNGLFNWLLSIDTTKKMLTTGGAPFSKDPYTDGYCFANGTVKPDGGFP